MNGIIWLNCWKDEETDFSLYIEVKLNNNRIIIDNNL